MHLIRTNKSNESATETHAEISRLQINIEESNALTFKKKSTEKKARNNSMKSTFVYFLI